MESVVNITQRFEILTPTGWSKFNGVRKIKKRGVIDLITGSNKHLKCTFDHKIKTPLGFIEAQYIKDGDKILTKDGVDYVKTIHLDINSYEDVFDAIDVENYNEYYTDEIVSHNCQWIGSSGTLISGAVLKTLTNKTPKFETDGLKIYEEKTGNHNYVIVADVSRGKGLDYSAFHVIDVTEMPYKQVATYRNNMVTPLDYSTVIHTISRRYNSASILVEINDIGAQVADSLFFDYENESILYTENAGARGKQVSMGFGKDTSRDRGIRTTKTVKAVGCSILKLLVEQRKLIINDHETIRELSTFSKKNTSYEAEPGCHDDLVMGLVLFAWLSDQKYFKELTDIETLKELRDLTDEQIEQNLVPFGFADFGEVSEEQSVIDIIDHRNMDHYFF